MFAASERALKLLQIRRIVGGSNGSQCIKESTWAVVTSGTKLGPVMLRRWCKYGVIVGQLIDIDLRYLVL